MKKIVYVLVLLLLSSMVFASGYNHYPTFKKIDNCKLVGYPLTVYGGVYCGMIESKHFGNMTLKASFQSENVLLKHIERSKIYD